jgi:hypothetical protein
MEDRYTFTDSLKAILREATIFNYMAFILGVAITVFCLGANGNSTGFYSENWLIFWVVAYLLILIGLLMPLNKVKYLPYGKRIFYSLMLILTVIFLFLFEIIWSEFKSPTQMDESSLDVLGFSIASSVAVFGWFVQHQLTRQHNKVSHSLNILLQMRVSEEFQKHMTDANKHYPSRKKTVIPVEDVNLYSRNDEVDCKIKSISSHIYLLNYYEFLAYGIKSGALDEELLFQTLGGIVVGHYRRAENMIKHARSESPKIYESLVNLEDRWSVRRNYDDTQLKKKLNQSRKGI